MEILVFDIVGKFAHFRKFFSNSSALSYYIPPRTTICGMIAGILGEPRDSYYDKFNMENCQIGLRLLSKIKKNIQTLKYLMVKSPNDLNGSNKESSNTLVPFEILSPINIADKDSWVKYRVYYSAKTEQHYEETFIKFKENLYSSSSIVFPLTMGTANFTSHIENIVLYNDKQYIIDNDSQNGASVEIHSVIPKSSIYNFEVNSECHIMQETIPMEFDDTRSLIKQDDVIFDLNCNPISVYTKGNIITLKNKNNRIENILFF